LIHQTHLLIINDNNNKKHQTIRKDMNHLLFKKIKNKNKKKFKENT